MKIGSQITIPNFIFIILLRKIPGFTGLLRFGFWILRHFYAILALKYIGFYQNPPFSGGFYC